MTILRKAEVVKYFVLQEIYAPVFSEMGLFCYGGAGIEQAHHRPRDSSFKMSSAVAWAL